jgi:NADH-quinone oxidoreductase subunit M
MALPTQAAAAMHMGLWPLPFTEVLHTSVNDLVAHVGQSKLPAR